MNKLLTFIFMGLFLMSFASAWLWTESVVYSEQDMKVELKSFWGFFEWMGIDQTVGTIELKSHKSVDEVVQYGIGKQVTMFYDFDFKDIYENGLGEVDFINMKTGKEVERDFKFVYEFTEERSRENCIEYEVIEVIDNSTIEGDLKEPIINPVEPKCLKYETEFYNHSEWRDYHYKLIPKGKIRIGIEVDNKQGDYIDGIWIIGGKSINKHASWNASLKNGLISYYKLDEASGNASDSFGSYNLTNTGVDMNKSGIINTSAEFTDSSADKLKNSNYSTSFNTINLWVYLTDMANFDTLWVMNDGTDDINLYHNNGLIFSNWNGSTVKATTNYPMANYTGKWTMITTVTNDTHMKLYLNATEVASVTKQSNTFGTLTFTLGNTHALSRAPNGKIDEVAIFNRTLSNSEITTIFNNGLGLSFDETNALTVELKTPVNNSNFTTPSIEFTVNVTQSLNAIENVTLIITGNDTYNRTIAGDGSKVYTFSESGFDSGNYTWTASAFDNESKIFFANQTRKFKVEITEAIGISLLNPTNNLMTNRTSLNFNATITPVDVHVDNVTFTLIPNGSGQINTTQTDLGEVEFTWSQLVSDFPATDNNYSWFLTSCGTGSLTSDVICETSATRTFEIDTTNPTLTATINESILMFEGAKILLNTTATDKNLDTVIYSYNGTNTTITGTVSGQTNQTTITTTLTALQIIVYATDEAGNTAIPVTLNLTIDPTAPTITLNYPTALVNYGKLNQTLQLNFTATDTNLDKVWYEYNETINSFETDFDGWTNNTVYSGTPQRSTAWSSKGNYSIRLYAALGMGGGTAILQKIIDADSITFDWSGDQIKVMENGNVIYSSFDNTEYNVTLNITRGSVITISSDPDPSGYNAYIDNIRYYHQNNIIGATSGVYNISNITLGTRKNITIFANDTAGNINATTFSWDYKVFENSKTYSETTISGAGEQFKTNITYSSLYSGINVILNYNGTNYTMSSSNTGFTKEYVYNLTIPGVTTQTNITTYFIYVLSNSTETSQINSDSFDQTINPFLIDNCSTYSNTLLNFIMVDEDSLSGINGTIEVNVNIYSYGTTSLVNSYNTSFNYLTTTSSRVCLQNITQDYTMSYQIRHYGSISQYFPKYRNVQRMTINNETLSQNITLYNLNLTRGYAFNVIVVGNLQSLIGNRGLLVDTQRQYLSLNEFKSVETSITNADGIAVSHLIPTSEIYNFLVSYNGELLGTFNNYQVQCSNAPLGQCSITLNLAQATGTAPDFEDYGYISQIILLDNDAHILYHTFSSTDGESKDFISLVTKLDGYGNTTICNNSAVGTSGTLTCNIPTIYQNSTFLVQTFVDGELIGSKSFSQGVDQNWYGVDTIIILLGFSSFVLLFVGHPITIVLGAVLGLFFPVLLISIAGLSFTTIIGSLAYWIAGGILIAIVIRRKM